MDLLNMGAQLFMEQLGGNAENLGSDNVVSALSNLLPTGQSGDIDLGALVEQFSSGGLGSVVSSFLGTGANDALSVDNIMGMFGEGKVAEFAGSLGLSNDVAAEGLGSMVSNLIDLNSEGGQLLQSVGNSVVGSLASKFF